MDACICLDRGKPPAHSVLPPAQDIDPESLIMPGKIIKQKIKVIYMPVYPPFGQGGVSCTCAGMCGVLVLMIA